MCISSYRLLHLGWTETLRKQKITRSAAVRANTDLCPTHSNHITLAQWAHLTLLRYSYKSQPPCHFFFLHLQSFPGFSFSFHRQANSNTLRGIRSPLMRIAPILAFRRHQAYAPLSKNHTRMLAFLLSRSRFSQTGLAPCHPETNEGNSGAIVLLWTNSL